MFHVLSLEFNILRTDSSSILQYQPCILDIMKCFRRLGDKFSAGLIWRILNIANILNKLERSLRMTFIYIHLRYITSFNDLFFSYVTNNNQIKVAHLFLFVCLMVFSTTFNNISVGRIILLVDQIFVTFYHFILW